MSKQIPPLDTELRGFSALVRGKPFFFFPGFWPLFCGEVQPLKTLAGEPCRPHFPSDLIGLWCIPGGGIFWCWSLVWKNGFGKWPGAQALVWGDQNIIPSGFP